MRKSNLADGKKGKKQVSKSLSYGRFGSIAFVFLLLIGLAALATIASLSIQYSSGTNEQAIVMAGSYSQEINGRFAMQILSFREKTSAVAVSAAAYTDKEALDGFLNDVPRADGYRDVILNEIRYFKGDKEYSQRLEEEIAADDENVYVMDMRRNNKLATYGMVYDAKGTKPSVACYCPVEGSELLDGIVLYFPQESVLAFLDNLDEKRAEYADFQAICCANADNGAQILAIVRDKSDSVVINDSFYTYLSGRTNDTAVSRKVQALIEADVSGSELIEINNERYVVCVGHANRSDVGVYVVSLYQAKNVYSEGYDLISTIITIMAILVMVLIVFAIYFFFSRRRINARIEEINMVNPILDCPTLLKFEKNAGELFARYHTIKYAVVVSHVQHFGYIADTYGTSTSVDIVRHIKTSIYNALSAEETYGYISDGEFAFLLVFSNEDKLNDRLLSLKNRIQSLPSEIAVGEYRITVQFGVYVMEESDRGASESAVSKMVNKAMSVRSEAALMNVKRVYNLYTPTMDNKLMRRAEIESRMETALAAGEFRVFYQPKYNLQKEDIDGAELLVRWYDAERKRYRRPDEFLPVFEENGFITKLDRQVYYTACETLADWSAKGRRVYPISVNVSRVTAIQEDFLAYYETVKKRFNIPNDFITLEFTESFAYENYDYLGAIAQRLRTAGFLCSIDDFGTGSSTFGTLQKMEMDEIKLDRFFIIDDPLSDKEKIILQNVINLGKSLHMKVTQEGVETREYVRMLRKMGCEVIQGYYFAKPMGVEDYEKFIDSFIATGRILGEESPDFDAK